MDTPTDEEILATLRGLFADKPMVLLVQEADHMRVVSTHGPEAVARVLRSSAELLEAGGAYDQRRVRSQ